MDASPIPNISKCDCRIRRRETLALVCGLSVLVGASGVYAQCSPTLLTVRQTIQSPFTGPYAMNGVSRLPLVLIEGQSYTFDFPAAAGSGSSWPVPSIHPFILTTDPNGGPADVGTGQVTPTQLPGYTFGSHCATACESLGGHIFTCTPGPLTPTNFFYQCSTHINLGAPITILRLPVITQQPVGVVACAGGEAAFFVDATLTEGTLSYQWRRNGVPLGIQSAQTSVLTISSISGEDLGFYDCVVSNSCAQVITNAIPLSTCPADLANGSGQPGCDGGVDVNDLLFFLTAFESGSVEVDLDNGSGNGVPDGGVDINDLLFFLFRFEAGC